MRRAFQILALGLSIGLLGFLACHAQKRAAPVANDASKPSNGATGATPPDAAPAPPPPVYLPATKSGAAFIERQQGRR